MNFKKFKIYQVKMGIKQRDYRFTNLSFLKSMGMEVSKENYDLVFIGAMEESKDMLSEIFHTFNMEHPKYYSGRSLSVSDVVEIEGAYYYCDSFGWEKINF